MRIRSLRNREQRRWTGDCRKFVVWVRTTDRGALAHSDANAPQIFWRDDELLQEIKALGRTSIVLIEINRCFVLATPTFKIKDQHG